LIPGSKKGFILNTPKDLKKESGNQTVNPVPAVEVGKVGTIRFNSIIQDRSRNDLHECEISAG
jgi:hypothetical protein